MQARPEALLWGRAQLDNTNALAEIVCDTPYSRVTRLSAAEQFFYLKEVAGALRREPAVIAALTGWVSHVPSIIAGEADSGWFLMRDGGTAQRQIFRETQEVQGLLHGMQAYASIQLASRAHVGALLALGLPDWRVENLSTLWAQLLGAAELRDFMAGRDTAIAAGKLEAQCHILLQAGIPPCIEHADFHDANILVSPAGVQIIDWGEAVISHPFFSLARMLASLQSQHGLDMLDPVALAVQQAYFAPWQKQYSPAACKQALDAVLALAPFYTALAYAQLARASGEAGARYWQKNIPTLVEQCLTLR